MKKAFGKATGCICALVLTLGPAIAQTNSLQEAVSLIKQAVTLPSGDAQQPIVIERASEKMKYVLSSKDSQKPAELIPLLAALGQLYQNEDRNDASLYWWQKVVSIDSSDWRAWSKIVQCCQALGDLKQRDEARLHVLSLAKEGKVNQMMFCRDQFRDHGNPVMVLEYCKHDQPAFHINSPSQSTENIYSFVVQSPDRKATQYRYVLCEMAVDTDLARNQKSISADEHRYSIDRHEGSGLIALVGMFDGKQPPPYDTVKEAVLQDLAKRFRK